MFNFLKTISGLKTDINKLIEEEQRLKISLQEAEKSNRLAVHHLSQKDKRIKELEDELAQLKQVPAKNRSDMNFEERLAALEAEMGRRRNIILKFKEEASPDLVKALNTFNDPNPDMSRNTRIDNR